jgi:hypothetical protein
MIFICEVIKNYEIKEKDNMQGRYHIRRDGTPGLCRATTKPCPLGGEHFDSLDAAQDAFQKEMAMRDNGPPSRINVNTNASICPVCGAVVTKNPCTECDTTKEDMIKFYEKISDEYDKVNPPSTDGSSPGAWLRRKNKAITELLGNFHKTGVMQISGSSDPIIINVNDKSFGKASV